jgi:hypothetical protein
MSTILVNNIKDTGNNTLLTSDGSGNISSGGALTNTPAFEGYLSSNQSVSSDAWTKVQINTEVFDSNNNYDNSTNYRFTPTVAGKYHIFGAIALDAGASNLAEGYVAIRKNGSAFYETIFIPSSNANQFSPSLVTTVEANGTTDYFELWGRCTDTSGNPVFNSANRRTRFGAYKLIGA